MTHYSYMPRAGQATNIRICPAVTGNSQGKCKCSLTAQTPAGSCDTVTLLVEHLATPSLSALSVHAHKLAGHRVMKTTRVEAANNSTVECKIVQVRLGVQVWTVNMLVHQPYNL